MNDNRPSKKQQELLSYIDGFIKSNGYGPSYREVMRALEYKSVSTVAVHVDGLIARGLLRKTNHSARSLEVVSQMTIKRPDEEHIKWLKKEIKKRQADQNDKEAVVLTKALNILLDQKGD
jgi:SOS-response transcriptional repressor LexA